MRGLYAIVDVDFLGAREIPVISFAERVLRAEPAILQLRAKRLGGRATLDLLRALAPLCERHGSILFANDRPDLAVLAGAGGVHVGQADVRVHDVRTFAPGLRVGVSTHTEAEVEAALAEGPDYVAFGPVFPTTSKESPEATVGLEGLSRASELCSAASVPLVAIGGIDLERAPFVREHADLVAVISALLPAEGLDGVEDTARALAQHRL
jgi:thiamine-phosphate pyrophosphorylase